ncbi:MAG: YfbK domain-containing protein [Bacteroidia bacterium]
MKNQKEIIRGLAVLAVVFIEVACFGQVNIRGRLLDSIQKSPVPYATIMVANGAKKVTGTYSDEQGFFDLKVDASMVTDTIVLTVKSLDYSDFVKMIPVKMIKSSIDSIYLTPLTNHEIGAIVINSRKPLRSNNMLSVACAGVIQKKSNSRNRRILSNVYSVVEHNNENYSKPQENGFKDVKRDPLSTVSIDVDKASYSNIRRYINMGSMPPVEAVRVEELINYFQYEYPEVNEGEPISSFIQMTDCPWNKKHQLLQIGIKGKSLQEGNKPNSNLVFLLDVSGSMQAANKLDLVKKSLTLLLDNLLPDDRVAIVVYAGNSGLVLPSTSIASGKIDIIDAIYRLEAGGSTAGGAGIELAYKTALENFIEQGNNRVILCTDGDFNVGVSDIGGLTRLIEKKKESGVFLSVLGFGMGNYKDDNLEILADKGNGNYAYIDDFKEAKKVFMNEVGCTLYTVAKDVKVQVEFNPKKIKSYRLIGYENRILEDEDFNDDSKDAGDLGENGTVTFLYEIVPFGEETDVYGTVDTLKYQEVREKGNSEEFCTVKFRYKEPNGLKSKLIEISHIEMPKDISEADENIKLATTLALYGMILSESEYAKGMTMKDVSKSLSSVSRESEDIAEFKSLVKAAQKIR